MNIYELVKKAGSQSELAKAFGVTRMAVTHWMRDGKLPQSRVWQIEAGAVKLPEKRLQPISGEGKGKV